jgi:hypothetical protein
VSWTTSESSRPKGSTPSPGNSARACTRWWGPARADAIVAAEIRGAAHLPRGVGDRQGPGASCIHPRQDGMFLGFGALAQSTELAFSPTEAVVWRSE